MYDSIVRTAVFTGFCLVTGQVQAAITQNDLSGLAPLNAGNTSVDGIAVDPLVTGTFGSPDLAATFLAPTFTVSEQGPDYIGVGQPVPSGTDLTVFTVMVGQPLTFDMSNSSGVYFAPFYKDPIGGNPGGVGYLTFNYDNPTATLTFVSSTVQDVLGEPLVVAGVPEPAITMLGALGFIALLRRRR